MGGGTEPYKPVHEPTTDSRFGEDETGHSAVLAPPRHRSGLDAGGLPADPQGRCSWHRRCHGGRLRSESGGQSLGSSGSHQVRPLSRTAGPSSLHSQGGWLAEDARHSNLRRQGGATREAYPVDSGAYHIEWPRKDSFACLAPHMGVTGTNGISRRRTAPQRKRQAKRVWQMATDQM